MTVARVGERPLRVSIRSMGVAALAIAVNLVPVQPAR
jgi:hypothetical protein